MEKILSYPFVLILMATYCYAVYSAYKMNEHAEPEEESIRKE